MYAFFVVALRKQRPIFIYFNYDIHSVVETTHLRFQDIYPPFNGAGKINVRGLHTS